jgi:hypothetical protein
MLQTIQRAWTPCKAMAVGGAGSCFNYRYATLNVMRATLLRHKSYILYASLSILKAHFCIVYASSLHFKAGGAIFVATAMWPLLGLFAARKARRKNVVFMASELSFHAIMNCLFKDLSKKNMHASFLGRNANGATMARTPVAPTFETLVPSADEAKKKGRLLSAANLNVFFITCIKSLESSIC